MNDFTFLMLVSNRLLAVPPPPIAPHIEPASKAKIDKYCNVCCTTKPISEFRVRRHGSKGQPIYHSQCSACQMTLQRIRRAKKRGDMQ